ncbi:uncharacterized protein zgc:174888 [Trichomycterus rosablanca]|uniref:uncharacterized protein zgc:174888 n=1 Tax=Trichomycterus rosablanca TaxID=2290929 RepID=UPI002F35DF12
MVPTVVLLLSVLTVQGSAECDDLKKATVSNLKKSIKQERQIGFLKVFPKNYYVQHHLNGSTKCEEPCCVFRAVMLLSHSWEQLLLHLEPIHIKHTFITELMFNLNIIGEEGFQETPDPSFFPSVHSSPGALLDFTSEVFSKWLDLNCPVGDRTCVFATPAPAEEEIAEGVVEKLRCEKSGDRAKRCVTNRDMGRSASPLLLLCTMFSLRMLLDVVLGELG